jgi:pimeloyl-ACP methyl ester carboxylesterase
MNRSRPNRYGLLVGAALLGAVLLAGIGVAQAGRRLPEIASREFMVASPRPGIEIYVRNKHLAGLARFGPSRTLLFVHGATYPASTSFDLALGGFSWMDYMALHGFDVYLLDLPGYGRSTRPPEMDAPAAANPPFEDTADAVADYTAVADHIMNERRLDRLDAMGWSWGTTIAAGFAAAHPDQVNRLVLYAPLWIIRNAPPLPAGAGKLGAYRTVTKEAARERWLKGLSAEQQEDLIPDDWFDRWAAATWATDPASARTGPPLLRAPNGVLLDIVRYWRAGKPTYDPSRITAPVLLVQGEWDHDTPPYMSLALFALLTHAAWKQYTLIGEGTHHIIMEKNRMQLFQVVQDFLGAQPPR